MNAEEREVIREREKLIQTIAAWGMQHGISLEASSLADAILAQLEVENE